MSNKSVVVLVSENYIDDTVDEPNNRKINSILTTLIEKRLDFRYHKNVLAKIEESVTEIQDHIWRFAGFEPEAQEVNLAKIAVDSDDIVTREYYDATLGEYQNTKESMLTISFALSSTSSQESITAYDVLTCFGDLGGLRDFFLWVLTPLIGYIIGDRFSYIILRSLYMQNRSSAQHGDDNEFDDPNDVMAQRVKQSYWLQNTKPYNESAQTQFLLNEWVQCLMCRSLTSSKKCGKCIPKTDSEKIFEKGNDRVERNLDVRNIIKAQETLKNLLHTVVPSKEKRKLLRLQRRSLVLEPLGSSSDSEDDFTAFKGFYKQFQKKFRFFDDENYGDQQQLKLLKGVLDRDAMIESKKRKKIKRSRSIDTAKDSYKTLDDDNLSRADSSARQFNIQRGISNPIKAQAINVEPLDSLVDIEEVDMEREGTNMRLGQESPAASGEGQGADDFQRSQSHGIVLQSKRKGSTVKPKKVQASSKFVQVY